MSFTLTPLQAALVGYAPLTAIVPAERISFTIAPEGNGRPYIVWSLDQSQPENSLSCIPDIDYETLTVDCYSADQPQCYAMVQAAVDAVQGMGYIQQGPWQPFEPNLKLYRWSFSIQVIQSRA